MISQMIIDIYKHLPKAQRTSLRISSELQARGYAVSPSYVGEVLKATVLTEVVTAKDLQATSRVLRTLIDFEPAFRNEDVADQSVLRLAHQITRGLEQVDSGSACEIEEALGLIIDLFCQPHDDAEQPDEYSQRGPAPRWLM